MTNRYAIILTVLAVLVVGGYHLRHPEGATASRTPRSDAGAPAIEAAPSLQLGAPPKSGIASMDVWDLKPAAMPIGNLPPLKDLFKPYYTLNKNGRFEALTRSDRPTEQWQFQGVLVRSGNMRALFYNPGLKKLKNLGRGEMVDERLAVREIGSNSVTVEVVGEKKPQRFNLRIFNANRELYVTKRKTP